MKTVYKFIKPYMGLIIFCLLIKTVSAFTELAIPSILATIIDEAVPARDMRAVWVNGGAMLIFAVLTAVLNIVGNRLSATASGHIAYDIREALFEKTVGLDTADTDRLGLSSLTSRMTSDTYNITAFMARLMRVGLRGPLMLIGGLVITLTIDIRLASVLFLVMPPVCITVYLITSRSVPLYKEQQKILDSMVRKVDETASGIRVIKALSRTEYEKGRFSSISRGLSEKEIKAGRLMSLNKPLTDLLLNLGFCLVILLGAFLSERYGFNATGKLLAFMTYFTIILNNMIMMTRIFVQTSRSIASANRIEEVLLCENKLTLCDIEPEESEYHIEFDRVSFSYNKRLPDLEQVSFGIKRGETLGIIGPTGAGKSTVINLLLRLYDVDEGAIRIDGRDVRSIPDRELHSKFGVVFQNGFLYAGSIRDNVAFFREGDIDKSLSVAQAAEFVGEREDGIDFMLAGRGNNLSGGQKQRLLIARAVYSDPEILILDDSSSALDYKTDSNLRRAINKQTDSTTVIIAQRISSVKNADLILVIDDGRVIGSGTHASLMEECEEYRRIAEVQMGGVGV